MTKFPEIWNALTAPFDKANVEQRNISGKPVNYITARSAMNRLDEVLGFEKWEDRYERDPFGGDGVVCILTIELPDGRRVTKSDAGSPSKTGDDGTDDKGAFSDAFKRAAVKFGVGRDLYGEGVYRVPIVGSGASIEPASAGQVQIHDPGDEASPQHRERERMPSQARAPHHPEPAPSRSSGRRPHSEGESQSQSQSSGGGQPVKGSRPKVGKQLFPWLKDQEEKFGAGLLKYVMSWGKLQEFPARIVDWDAAQTAEGYDEACRKLEALQADASQEAMAN